MLQNDGSAPLTVAQIAAHLHTRAWNVTRELQMGAKGQSGRLRGARARNQGPGRGGPWTVEQRAYLDWLGIPAEDRTHLGPDGLPQLITLAVAAEKLDIPVGTLRVLIRQQRYPHVRFGRTQYLTHNQLDGIRVQLSEDYRD